MLVYLTWMHLRKKLTNLIINIKIKLESFKLIQIECQFSKEQSCLPAVNDCEPAFAAEPESPMPTPMPPP